jgi:sugar phosphate isomerase/epimerase
VRLPDGFSWTEFWRVFTSSIRDCSRIAADHGLELLIEPRVGEVVSTADGLLRLFDAVPEENLGAILDIAHQYAQKELLPLSIAKLGSRIRYVHVADNDGTENRHLPPGEGTVDWEGVFLALRQQGYEGFYAVDVEKLPDLRQKFMQSRATLEEYGARYGL